LAAKIKKATAWVAFYYSVMKLFKLLLIALVLLILSHR
jgi:hypothetical protein